MRKAKSFGSAHIVPADIELSTQSAFGRYPSRMFAEKNFERFQANPWRSGLEANSSWR